jgi:glycosyltransferase involved in cell wall biosynthesis
MNIAILFSNFGPYHLARLQAFNDLCHAKSWSCNGIELAQHQIEYPWKPANKKLQGTIISITKNQALEKVNFITLVKQLYQVLFQVKPDILVVSGYSRPTMLCAVLWTVINRKKAILLSESKEDDAVRIRWQETIKLWLIKCYKSALVGGKIHKDYLAKLGMSSQAIFYGYDVVDNSVFTPQQIKSLPKNLNRPYFLAINRFIPKKNLLNLMESYSQYRQLAGEQAWDLVLCGDGELKEQIEAKITQLSLQDVVHLPGFLQQEQLLPYFAHASCFVHASTTEQWGLVVNEAMAAGLPVIVSERCGCFEDLVVEGVNGFGFNPENKAQLTQLMSKISSKNINLQNMGQASLEHIQKYSPDYFATGLKQAVEYAISH